MDRVKPEYLRKQYNLFKDGAPEQWADAEDFLTLIALNSGRLLKHGEPDINTVAKMVLNDFQRGKLPYYAMPPGCDNEKGDDDEVSFLIFIFITLGSNQRTRRR